MQGLKVVRFGAFELDVSAGELRKQGRKINLQQQPFQVLALLLRRPGELVTREELQQELWPAETFVEFDQGLNTAIRKSARRWTTSPTTRAPSRLFPSKGYRFVAPVAMLKLLLQGHWKDFLGGDRGWLRRSSSRSTREPLGGY